MQSEVHWRASSETSGSRLEALGFSHTAPTCSKRLKPSFYMWLLHLGGPVKHTSPLKLVWWQDWLKYIYIYILYQYKITSGKNINLNVKNVIIYSNCLHFSSKPKRHNGRIKATFGSRAWGWRPLVWTKLLQSHFCGHFCIVLLTF